MSDNTDRSGLWWRALTTRSIYLPMMMIVIVFCTAAIGEEKLNIFDHFKCKLLNLTNYKQTFFSLKETIEKRKYYWPNNN